MVRVITEITENSIVLPAQPPKEMLSVSQEGEKTLVRINSSSLSIIQECLRKSQYSLIEKWRPETEPPATVFGGAIHKALEIYYSGTFEQRSLPKLETMIMMSYGHRIEGEEENLILRATRGFIEKAQPLSLLPETDKRSIQNGVWILYHYFKSFIDDPYVAYVDESGPFVERPFTLRLFEDEKLIVDYFGTIDLVVRHLKNNNILVCDHKTSSIVGNDFYNRLKPNAQYTGYLLGAREVFGIETNAFLVSCLQVKSKPVTERGSPPHFPRQETTRDDADFAEFKDSVVWAVRSFLAARSSGIFALGNVNACAMYAGCNYLSVCSAPKSLRENILKAKFIRKTDEAKSN